METITCQNQSTFLESPCTKQHQRRTDLCIHETLAQVLSDTQKKPYANSDWLERQANAEKKISCMTMTNKTCKKMDIEQDCKGDGAPGVDPSNDDGGNGTTSTMGPATTTTTPHGINNHRPLYPKELLERPPPLRLEAITHDCVYLVTENVQPSLRCSHQPFEQKHFDRGTFEERVDFMMRICLSCADLPSSS